MGICQICQTNYAPEYLHLLSESLVCPCFSADIDNVVVAINGQDTDGRLDRIHFISRTLQKTGVIYPDQDVDASSATLGVIFVFPIEQLPDLVTMNQRMKPAACLRH